MASAGAAIDGLQAVLTGLDTTLSKQWRDEERRWREADLSWREQEASFVEEQREWRAQDLQQRALDNARTIWDRHVEKNRRAVEERAEQLKSVSNLAALIAGFALVAFLQFDFSQGQGSSGVQLAFGLTIAVVVALEALAMVMCSLIHASILKTGRTYVSSEEEADFMARARAFAAMYRPGDRPPAPRRNFQRHWQYACDRDWRLAFLMYSAGIPVFFAMMALAAWIKFDYSAATSTSMTGVLGLAFGLFLAVQNKWSWHLVGRQGAVFEDTIPQAQPGGMPWDWHLRPMAAGGKSRPSDGMPGGRSAGAEL